MYKSLFLRLWNPKLTLPAHYGFISRVHMATSLNQEKFLLKQNQQRQQYEERNIDFSMLNPDKFGDLNELYNRPQNKTLLKAEYAEDDQDGYDKLEIKRGIKMSLAAYMRIFAEIRRQKPTDVAKMLTLHRQFIYEDRYIPDEKLYSILITACAEVGFTKKAIELLDEMTRFGLKPTKATVTSLFNACANCTHTVDYAVQQALELRERLQLDGYEFNEIQYNVIIKTFARLGQWEIAQNTVKELIGKGHSPTQETYAMLLMGCISDKRQGLFEATKLLSEITNTRLNLHLVNLFLRCIRDCEIGNDNLLKLCSGTPFASSNSPATDATEQLPQRLPTFSSNVDSQNLPNLLSGENLERIVSIDQTSLSFPSNRFLLFGGLPGFITLLDSCSIKPNLKTITLFIDLMDIENCVTETKQLLQRYGLKADIYLYNVLIKKLSKRGKYSLCQEVIRAMQDESIRPDIMTFGALTFACINARKAKYLLRDISQCGIIVNHKIMGSLINIACSREDLDYVAFMLQYIEKEQLSLSRIDVEQIDLLLKKIHREIANSERRNLPFDKERKEKYKHVSSIFRVMLKNSKITVATHPWSQFEASPIVSKKEKFNSVVRYMKQKQDIKMRKDIKPEIEDYNDEIDP